MKLQLFLYALAFAAFTVATTEVWPGAEADYASYPESSVTYRDHILTQWYYNKAANSNPDPTLIASYMDPKALWSTPQFPQMDYQGSMQDYGYWIQDFQLSVPGWSQQVYMSHTQEATICQGSGSKFDGLYDSYVRTTGVSPTIPAVSCVSDQTPSEQYNCWKKKLCFGFSTKGYHSIGNLTDYIPRFQLDHDTGAPLKNATSGDYLYLPFEYWIPPSNKVFNFTTIKLSEWIKFPGSESAIAFKTWKTFDGGRMSFGLQLKNQQGQRANIMWDAYFTIEGGKVYPPYCASPPFGTDYHCEECNRQGLPCTKWW